jgi:hypothetical protein
LGSTAEELRGRCAWLHRGVSVTFVQQDTEGSPEEAELESVVDAIEAYDAKRWPNGKEAGGKG